MHQRVNGTQAKVIDGQRIALPGHLIAEQIL